MNDARKRDTLFKSLLTLALMGVHNRCARQFMYSVVSAYSDVFSSRASNVVLAPPFARPCPFFR